MSRPSFFEGSLIFFVILACSIVVPLAYADRGGFSPLRELVSESGQKAIVAWNGTYEVLILSTDVSSGTESDVVEIMPLPSNPLISKGEKQSFLKVQDLINMYLAVTTSRWTFAPGRGASGGQSAPSITITFQEMIGVHYITVVRAENSNELIDWLEDFLEKAGYDKWFPSEMEELIPYYIQKGMNFFVIDVIKANSTVQTIDPLVYKFRSAKLYYPLLISSLFSGDTEIFLVTITSDVLDDNSIVEEGFVKNAQFQVKQETLNEISSNITELFSGNPYLCYFRFSGSLSFEGDILAGFQFSPIVPIVLMAMLGLYLAVIFLVFLFPANRMGFGLKTVHKPLVRRLKIASLSIGLIGLFLAWIGCFIPEGLVEYGNTREVLIALTGDSFPPLMIVIPSLMLPLLVSTALYIHLLLAKRDSRGLSLVLTASGAYMMLQALILCTNYLFTMNIGMLAIITGCLSLLSAGLLSFWRITLTPIDVILASKGITFKTYIVTKFLTAIITVIGISVFFYWAVLFFAP